MTVLPLEHLRETFDGDTDILKSILEMFLEEVPTDYEQLVLAINAGDYENAGLIAHKIKSSYRTLGIDSMASILQEIEDRAKENKGTEKIPELLESFVSAYDTVNEKVINTASQF